MMDIESVKGRFGWEQFGEDKVLPFIVRMVNGKYRKFVSVRMAENELINKYLDFFGAKIFTCKLVPGYVITEAEAKVLNEVNKKHAEYKYGSKLFVTGKDCIVPLEDFHEFYLFVLLCYKRLTGITTSGLQERCGFIKIDSESVVPYCCGEDGKRYVPLFFFEGEMALLQSHIIRINNWNLAYLKFCCMVQGIRDEEFADDWCRVISLDNVRSYFSPPFTYEDFWPPTVFKKSELVRPVIEEPNAPGCWVHIQKPKPFVINPTSIPALPKKPPLLVVPAPPVILLPADVPRLFNNVNQKTNDSTENLHNAKTENRQRQSVKRNHVELEEETAVKKRLSTKSKSTEKRTRKLDEEEPKMNKRLSIKEKKETNKIEKAHPSTSSNDETNKFGVATVNEKYESVPLQTAKSIVAESSKGKTTTSALNLLESNSSMSINAAGPSKASNPTNAVVTQPGKMAPHPSTSSNDETNKFGVATVNEKYESVPLRTAKSVVAESSKDKTTASALNVLESNSSMSINAAGPSEASNPTNAVVTRPGKMAPHIDRTKFYDIIIKSGRTINFDINVTGEPVPKTKWLKNYKDIHVGDRMKQTHIDYNSKISIRLAKREDSGFYILTATNINGKDMASVEVTILDKPSVPEGPLKISDVYEKGCKLSWKKPKDDGGQQIENYCIEKFDEARGNWVHADKTDGPVTNLYIKNLLPGHKYKFRVKAVNKQGKSDPLLTYQSITAENPFETPSRPLNPEIQDYAIEFVELVWDQPRTDGGSPITGYIIEKKDNLSSTWVRAVETSLKRGIVPELIEGYQYEFRVRAVNKAGISTASKSTLPHVAKHKKLTTHNDCNMLSNVKPLAENLFKFNTTESIYIKNEESLKILELFNLKRFDDGIYHFVAKDSDALKSDESISTKKPYKIPVESGQPKITDLTCTKQKHEREEPVTENVIPKKEKLSTDCCNEISTTEMDTVHLRQLFVHSLSSNTTDEDLKKHFEQWGKIINSIVLKNPVTKLSRRSGFITYAAAHMVDKAQDARPHRLNGKLIELKRVIPKIDIGNPEMDATVNTLFVRWMDDSITEEHLKEYFSVYGNVINTHLILDKNTGKKLLYGFVEFDDYDPVDKICLIGQHKINEKYISVKKALNNENKSRARAIKLEAKDKVNKLFFSPAQRVAEEDIKEYFSAYGNVTSVTIPITKNNFKKSEFGFVEFDDYAPVDEICLKEQHKIKGIYIQVKKFKDMARVNAINNSHSTDNCGGDNHRWRDGNDLDQRGSGPSFQGSNRRGPSTSTWDYNFGNGYQQNFDSGPIRRNRSRYNELSGRNFTSVEGNNFGERRQGVSRRRNSFY